MLMRMEVILRCVCNFIIRFCFKLYLIARSLICLNVSVSYDCLVSLVSFLLRIMCKFYIRFLSTQLISW